MAQGRRIILAVVILVGIIGMVLTVELVRRVRDGRAEGTAVPGAIPIYWNGEITASFMPADLEALEEASFVDAEEGKTQSGWLLRDVLRLHLDEAQLRPDTEIAVSSSSRSKQATLTWAEVEDPDNWVMFDLAGRGTVKLVSTLERLDVRDEWIQDVDRIEVTGP